MYKTTRREGSVSLQWLINGLHLSCSQLTASQPNSHTCKTTLFPLAFPQSSIFHVGLLCRALRPVSSLMGITHKPLSFWTALWPILSDLWLSSQSDSQIQCTTGSEEQVPVLSCVFFLSCGHSQIFLSSCFSSPLNYLSLMYPFQWPHQFVRTLCSMAG